MKQAGRNAEWIARCLFGVTVLLFGLLVLITEARADWQEEWNKTVKAAEKEGKLNIAPVGSSWYPVFTGAFQKKFPKIKVTMLPEAGPGATGQRVVTERRAQRYLQDIYIGGGITPVALLYPNKAFVPIRQHLILPDVLDQSKWWQGKHHFGDPEYKYVFFFEGTARSGPISYNTNLVKPNEIKSFWDLVKPKWKGKIASYDPTRPGTAGAGARFFYHKLGPEFLTKLYGETVKTVSRDRRQILDWLARGRYSIALFLSYPDVTKAAKQGLPVKLFPTDHFKEGASLDVYNGSTGIFDRAPHPNAARVAVNWVLSREGQMAWMKVALEKGYDYATLREDIPAKLIPAGRRRKGVDYLYTADPELGNMKPIRDLLKKAQAKARGR